MLSRISFMSKTVSYHRLCGLSSHRVDFAVFLSNRFKTFTIQVIKVYIFLTLAKIVFGLSGTSRIWDGEFSPEAGMSLERTEQILFEFGYDLRVKHIYFILYRYTCGDRDWERVFGSMLYKKYNGYVCNVPNEHQLLLCNSCGDFFIFSQ